MSEILDMDAWTSWVEQTLAEHGTRISQNEYSISDLQHRMVVLEERVQQILDSYTRLLDFLSGRTINRADMTVILEPISLPGELPIVAGAEPALLGLESSELLVSPRPGGSSKSITYGGGSGSPPDPVSTGTPSDNSSGEPDLTRVVWLGTNISSWTQTVTLTASIDPVNLRLAFASSWTPQRIGSRSIEGTAWVFVNQGGTYYAAPFADVLAGQRTWARTDVNGALVDLPPVEFGWVPTPGVRYWFMVSGVARGQVRNAQERSSLAAVTW